MIDTTQIRLRNHYTVGTRFTPPETVKTIDELCAEVDRLSAQRNTAVEALERLDTTYPISRDGIIQTALKEIKGEE